MGNDTFKEAMFQEELFCDVWHVFVDCVLWFAVAVLFQVVAWRKFSISKSVKAWAKDEHRGNSPIDWW